eukprot:187160-Chlamydomonas_euryale.AAC.1
MRATFEARRGEANERPGERPGRCHAVAVAVAWPTTNDRRTVAAQPTTVGPNHPTNHLTTQPTTVGPPFSARVRTRARHGRGRTRRGRRGV